MSDNLNTLYTLDKKSINSLKSEGQKKQNIFGKIIKNRLLLWVILLFLFLVLAYLLFTLYKPNLADKFSKKGDDLLNESRYLEALVQYNKAEYLNENEEIEQKILITDDAQKEISKLESLWRERNNKEAQENYNKAKKVYQSEYDSVVLSREFIEQKNPQFAIIAAKTAIEMEEGYKDAWLYLGISHFECAKYLQLTDENYSYHINGAKTAFEKTISLDPENEYAKKYLEEINKQ